MATYVPSTEKVDLTAVERRVLHSSAVSRLSEIGSIYSWLETHEAKYAESAKGLRESASEVFDVLDGIGWDPEPRPGAVELTPERRRWIEALADDCELASVEDSGISSEDATGFAMQAATLTGILAKGIA